MASRSQAQRAAEQHADDLSSYPNVVGIGVQPLDEARSGPQLEHAVAVYVERKVPRDELDLAEQLPGHVELPGRGGPIRVPIKVVESGSFAVEQLGGDEAPFRPQ